MESAPQSDTVLLPYLQATSEAESDAALEQVICEHAQPLIRNIIRARFRVGHTPSADLTDDEAGELVSKITLKLLARLNDLRAKTTEDINNFRGYVAVTTYHACDEYLRKKYPRRYSLKNQLRYILKHREGFAAWESDEGVLLCGFADWKGRKQVSTPKHLNEVAAKKFSAPDLLAAVFDQAGGPLIIDELVSLVAELWQVKDLVSPCESADLGIPSAEANALDTNIDQRHQLKTIWTEIAALPERQRLALLLSLRDPNGNGVLTLLPVIGVAALREIAVTLAMTEADLAALWSRLPLDDVAIAQLLDVTRQQVINLRKCARERLWRRTRKLFS